MVSRKLTKQTVVQYQTLVFSFVMITLLTKTGHAAFWETKPTMFKTKKLKLQSIKHLWHNFFSFYNPRELIWLVPNSNKYVAGKSSLGPVRASRALAQWDRHTSMRENLHCTATHSYSMALSLVVADLSPLLNLLYPVCKSENTKASLNTLDGIALVQAIPKTTTKFALVLKY